MDVPNEASVRGAMIRLAREQRGLTLAQVARRVGVSSTQLSKIERGEVRHPSSRYFPDLVRELELDRSQLVVAMDELGGISGTVNRRPA